MLELMVDIIEACRIEESNCRVQVDLGKYGFTIKITEPESSPIIDLEDDIQSLIDEYIIVENRYDLSNNVSMTKSHNTFKIKAIYHN